MGTKCRNKQRYSTEKTKTYNVALLPTKIFMLVVLYEHIDKIYQIYFLQLQKKTK